MTIGMPTAKYRYTLHNIISDNYEKIFRKKLDCEIIKNKNKTRILPIPVYSPPPRSPPTDKAVVVTTTSALQHAHSHPFMKFIR